MTPAERQTFRDEATDPARSTAFRASAAIAAAWDRAHPMSFDAYLRFLDDLQAVCGAFPLDRRPTRGSDFRL